MLSFFKEAGVNLDLVDGLLKVKGLKKLPPEQAQEIRDQIRDNREKIISELQIPAPEPPGMGAEYDRLWNEAWLLADFIDGDTAPLEARKERLPELLRMRDRLAEIEKQGGTNVSEGENPTAPSDFEEIKEIKQDGCPAKCKMTGKCYAAAYFEGKPGKAKDCEPDGCKWRAEQRHH